MEWNGANWTGRAGIGGRFFIWAGLILSVWILSANTQAEITVLDTQTLIEAPFDGANPPTSGTVCGLWPPTGGAHWAAMAPDGSVGMIVLQELYGPTSDRRTREVLYIHWRPDGSYTSEVITEYFTLGSSLGDFYPTSDAAEAIIYDSTLRPHAFFSTFGGTGPGDSVMHLVRQPNGDWEIVGNVALQGNLQRVYVPEPMSVCVDSTGTIHGVVTSVRDGVDYIEYFTGEPGAQDSEVVAQSSLYDAFGYYVDIAVDADGHVYIVASAPDSNVFADPLTVWHSKTGAWVQQTVQPPPEVPNYFGGWGPTISGTPEGSLGIAGYYVELDSSWMVTVSELRYHRRLSDGSWENIAITGQSDGYAGTAGTDYTGWEPKLVLDNSQKANILFSDVCLYSDVQVNQFGQMRLAAETDSGWDIVTLYSQPTPTGPWDGDEIEASWLGTSPGGGQIVAVGFEYVYRHSTQDIDNRNLVLVRAVNSERPDATVHVVSGWTDPPGALVDFVSDDGSLLAQVRSDDLGYYAFRWVPDGWTGSIVPVDSSQPWSPVQRNINALSGDLSDQNFTARTAVSGWRLWN